MEVDDNNYLKNAKLGQKESCRGSCDPHLEFWDPLYVSGTVKARNIKFGLQIVLICFTAAVWAFLVL